MKPNQKNPSAGIKRLLFSESNCLKSKKIKINQMKHCQSYLMACASTCSLFCYNRWTIHDLSRTSPSIWAWHPLLTTGNSPSLSASIFSSINSSSKNTNKESNVSPLISFPHFPLQFVSLPNLSPSFTTKLTEGMYVIAVSNHFFYLFLFSLECNPIISPEAILVKVTVTSAILKNV